MDYSSYPNDPDHPAGSSPWSSSPAPNKNTFAPVGTGSAPSSPLAKHTSSPIDTQNEEPDQGEPQLREDVGADDQEDPQSPLHDEPPQPNGAGQAPKRNISSSMPDIRFQDQPLTEEELRAKQAQQQRQQERYQQALHAQQHQRGPGPNRYHPGGRQGQRPPQYKLQAKITHLERTGKKDPAITFDVYVCTGETWIFLRLIVTDQPSQIPYHTSPGH